MGVENNMPEGWTVSVLGDVMDIFSGKSRPKDSGIYAVYGGNGIHSYGNKYNQQGETLIIGRVGAYCGNVFKEKNKFWLSDNALGVKSNEDSDLNYLYYKLKSMKLNNVSIGAAQPLLTQSLLKELEIIIPKKTSEQIAIAKVLTSFDDKIELLQAQNKTLETMAQTIFKEWFGKYQIGDELPEGWRVGRLRDLGDIICGKTPSKADKENFGGNIPFIKIPDMHNQMFIIKTSDSLTNKGASTQKNKLIPKNSICVSCIATVGLVSITSKDSQTNQQINSIIPFNDSCREFIYFKIKGLYKYLQDIGSGGTATLNVNTTSFSNIEIIIPDTKKLNAYNIIVNPIFDKVFNNYCQIQSLTKTRDTVLPKLMSGQVRVNNINEESNIVSGDLIENASGGIPDNIIDDGPEINLF